jgi:hypothetical protein
MTTPWIRNGRNLFGAGAALGLGGAALFAAGSIPAVEAWAAPDGQASGIALVRTIEQPETSARPAGGEPGKPSIVGPSEERPGSAPTNVEDAIVVAPVVDGPVTPSKTSPERLPGGAGKAVVDPADTIRPSTQDDREQPSHLTTVNPSTAGQLPGDLLESAAELPGARADLGQGPEVDRH